MIETLKPGKAENMIFRPDDRTSRTRTDRQTGLSSARVDLNRGGGGAPFGFETEQLPRQDRSLNHQCVSVKTQG